ncbi:MAG: cytochrome P450 [Solirubrobacteraceae bacterium]
MESTTPTADIGSQTGRCPVSAISAGFQPFSETYQADPYPFYERARSDEPVFFNEEIDAFVVTRYDDCATVLRDPETFSASPVVDFVTPPCAEAMQAILGSGFVPGPVTVNEDDPEHRAHRDVLRRAFNKRRMDELEPKIRSWVAGYVDKFVKHGSADLVLDYMWEIPALAAFHLIGVPDEEVDRVKAHAVSRAELNWGRPGPERQVELAESFGAFWQWCEQHVERLSQNPDDSFMSEMVELSKQPEYAEILDRTYVIRMCMNLLFAGHETTTNGAGNAFMALLQNRSQWEALVEDPSLIRNAADECLRYYSAAPIWRRRARVDTVLSGVHIPAGIEVLVAFASANRDDEHFPDAATLDVRRPNAKEHFTFGWGRHKCLGQGLARLEISIALEELVERLPHIHLVAGQAFSFAPNIIFRGPAHVYTEWDPTQNPQPADRPDAH